MTSRSASWRGHPDRSKALYSHRHPRYAKERRPSSRSSIARVRSLENWSRQMTRQQRRLRQSSNRLSDNHHRLVAATESGPSPDKRRRRRKQSTYWLTRLDVIGSLGRPHKNQCPRLISISASCHCRADGPYRRRRLIVLFFIGTFYCGNFFVDRACQSNGARNRSA